MQIWLPREAAAGQPLDTINLSIHVQEAGAGKRGEPGKTIGVENSERDRKITGWKPES